MDKELFEKFIEIIKEHHRLSGMENMTVLVQVSERIDCDSLEISYGPKHDEELICLEAGIIYRDGPLNKNSTIVSIIPYSEILYVGLI